MVSILNDLKNLVVDRISRKRTLETDSNCEEGLSAAEPASKRRCAHTAMDDAGNWVTVISSYFNQFVKLPVLRPMNRSQSYGAAGRRDGRRDDDGGSGGEEEEAPSYLGGVEVMPGTGRPDARRHHSRQLHERNDDVKFLFSSPQSAGRSKAYPVTPYPRAAAAGKPFSGRLEQAYSPDRYRGDKPVLDLDDASDHDDAADVIINGSNGSRVRHSNNSGSGRYSLGSGRHGNGSSSFNGGAGSRSQLNNTNTPGGVSNREALEMSSSSRHRLNGSSSRTFSQQQMRIGGNDGLVDVGFDCEEQEEDEGMDCVVGEPEAEVNIVGQYKSPGLSQFRFVPTITSTTERNILRARDRKENKWRSGPQTERRTASISRTVGGITKSYHNTSTVPMFGGPSSYRRTASTAAYGGEKRLAPPRRLLEARGGGGGSAAVGSRVKNYVKMLGLSNKYSSTAQECYKSLDKQRYTELLRQSAAPCDLSFSRSMSMLSSTSSAPLSKTVMGSDWTRQRTQEIENKQRLAKEQDSVSDISLWTQDEKNKQADKTSKDGKSDDASHKTKKSSKAGQSEKSASAKKEAGASKSKFDDDDDDDILITKETVVKRTIRPNSLEQQARFSAFYKFTPDWMDDLNARRIKKRTDLERQKQESELTVKMCLERRKKAPSVEDTVSHRFQMLDMKHPSPRIVISEEDDLVELTDQMEKIISNALRKHPPGEVLTEKFNIQITRRDIATLAGLNWLNDEVVNFYMNMLMERSENDNFQSVYAFNTFFYPKLIKMGFSGVKRWTKKVDVFSYDLLLVPVHLGMHWCLATINVKEKLVSYYDSMLGNNTQCLQELQKYLQDEHQDKKKCPLDMSGWSCDTLKDIPQQMNGSDCGMFACKFSEYLSRKRNITFTQDHMPYFRRRMVYEIVTNNLL